MESVTDVATFICSEFLDKFDRPIDEMKLHKLLYFVQRRSLADTDAPMFDAIFHAWKYGPVMPEIRSLYKTGSLQGQKAFLSAPSQQIVLAVMKELAGSDSMLLSSISHGELSWQRARERGERGESDDMRLDDIHEDAMRYRKRRELLKAWREYQNACSM